MNSIIFFRRLIKGIEKGFIISACLLGQQVFSQNIDWIGSISSAEDAIVNDLIIDDSDNIYVVGSFITEADLSGDGFADIFAHGGPGDQDGFLAKYDDLGGLIWALPIGGLSFDYIYGINFYQGFNNVIITGSFFDLADLDNTPGYELSTVSGGADNDAFYAIYSLDGVWDGSNFGVIGNSGDEVGTCVITDSNDNIYIGGRFSSFGINLDGAPGDELINLGAYDGFIIKFASNGAFNWARRVAGTLDDIVRDIAINVSDEPIVVGDFNTSADLNNDAGTDIVSYQGLAITNGFVARYTTTGDLQAGNVTRIGSPDNATAYSLVIDPSTSDIYVTGYFLTSADLDFDDATDFDSHGGADGYLVKYDNNLGKQWAFPIGGTGGDSGRRLCLDDQGNIFVTGRFYTEIDFNNDLNYEYFSYGFHDGFVGKYDPTGIYHWGFQFGSSADPLSPFGDTGSSLNINSYDVLVVGGFFYGDADFDADGFPDLTSLGMADGFIVSYPIPLEGNYVIGSSGAADYSDFSSAIWDLEYRGVSGPTTFDVESGVYNEQLYIPFITGTGGTDTNTITFQSQSGDSTLVTVSWSGDAIDNYVLSLDATEQTDFRGITFENTSPDYGTVIEILPATNYIRFYNNVFRSVSTVDDLVTRENFDAGYDLYTRFERNLFSGGFTGLYINETELVPLIRNIFENQAWGAIDMTEVARPVIVTNTITGSAASYSDAIYIESCLYGDGVTPGYFVIRRNRISIPGNGSNSGIYLTNINNDYMIQDGILSNNFIHINAIADNVEAISCNGVQHCNVYHNSINVTGSSSATTGIYVVDNNAIDFVNNIIVNTAGGTALSFAGTNTSLTSDYNDLYVTGPTLGENYGTGCSTLSVWQSTSGQDAGSVSIDPQFTSPGEPYTFNENLIAGAPLSAKVPDDIDYSPRDPVTPAIGAYEINMTENDSLALVAFYNTLGGPSWTTNTNWLTGTLDTWYGITVVDGRVTNIDLSSNNLIGTLPDELATLTKLNGISLNSNQITGEIPTGLWDVTTLTSIAMFLNNLSGNIPATIGNLSNLTVFDFGDNNLSGKLPSTISNLNNLSIFAIGNNNFTDTIPSLSNSLTELLVNSNQFTHISDLTGNTNINILQVQDNAFDFSDLEPYTSITNYTYSPQDSIGSSRTDSVDLYASFTLTVDAGGTNTSYQWYKDGVLIAGATSATYNDLQCTNEDFGEYYCVCTNNSLPDLTLYSRPISVVHSGQSVPVSTTNYTIDIDGAGDFLNFNEAVSFLINNGITGNVVFTVSDGTYSEQVNIPPISGTADYNKITFQSASQDSTAVILTWFADATNNYTLSLESGAEHFIFSQLTIQAENANYGHALLINGSNNQFLSNRFIGVINDQEEVNIAVIYGSVFDSTTFYDNRIENGSRGISFGWGANNQNLSNVVWGNSFHDQNGYPISLVYQDGCLIDGNQIFNTSGNGIDLRNSNYCRIINNRIKADLTNTVAGGIGISLYSSDGSDESGIFGQGLIANNFIYYNAEYSSDGINCSDLTDYGIYYNTVHIAGTVGYGSCFSLSGTCSGVEIINNIFSNDANSYSYYFATNTGFSSNFNDIHSTDNQQEFTPYRYASLVDDGGTQIDYSTLAEWQAASGNDGNSLSVHPGFEMADDFKILSPDIDNAGTNISLIAEDIEGRPRDATNPDMGCYEYTAPSLPDLSIQNQSAAPDTVLLGNSVSLGCGIHNTGTGNLRNTSTDLRIYLSSNLTLEISDDSLLIVIPFDSIDAGDYLTVNESFLFNGDYTPGNYNLLFIADQDNIAAESNEFNNFETFPIVLTEGNKPELDISSVTVSPDPINGYADFTISFDINNYGNTDMPQSTSCDIWLCDDEVVDGTGLEEHLSTFDTEVISAYNSQTISNMVLSVPDGVSSGSYNLILIIDPDNTIVETNETDNFMVYAVDIVYQDVNPPVISLIDDIELYNATSGDVNFRIQVLEDVQLDRVLCWHKGISRPDTEWQRSDLVMANTDTFYISINTSHMDVMGMELTFAAYDTKGNKDTTDTHYIYRQFTQDNSPSTTVHNGTNQSDYRLISIPYQLENKTVAGIFGDDFGTYDKTKWRLYKYVGNGNYDEMPSGDLTLGQGYWLINNTVSRFDIDNGTTPRYNRDNLFQLTLNSGWTIIGTPYPFSIAWNDILSFNNITEGVGNPIVFDGSYFEANNLDEWIGAFVQNTTGSDITLQIPVIDASGGARTASGTFSDKFKGSPDDGSWYMELSLKSESMINIFGGIGMHENAREGIDSFDGLTLPPFMNYLDLNHKGVIFHGSPLTRSIVNRTDTYSWEFEVVTNLTNETVTLTWNDKILKDQTSSILLIDMTNGKRIDMKDSDSYAFRAIPSTDFRILYQRDPEMSGISDFINPYPNPFSTEIYLPVYSKLDYKGASLVLNIYSINGNLIKQKSVISSGEGPFTVSWDGTNDTGKDMPAGVYFLQLDFLNDGPQSRYFRVIKE